MGKLTGHQVMLKEKLVIKIPSKVSTEFLECAGVETNLGAKGRLG
jgi:hypothetical protein